MPNALLRTLRAVRARLDAGLVAALVTLLTFIVCAVAIGVSDCARGFAP